MDQSIAKQCHASNTQEQTPRWMVLHNASGTQRRGWGPDIARLAQDLVEKYGWVMWREGADAHLKHRSMMAN